VNVNSPILACRLIRRKRTACQRPLRGAAEESISRHGMSDQLRPHLIDWLAYDDPDEQSLSEDGLKFRLAREGKSRWD
jgi:hypothetical protein